MNKETFTLSDGIAYVIDFFVIGRFSASPAPAQRTDNYHIFYLLQQMNVNVQCINHLIVASLECYVFNRSVCIFQN